MGIVCSACKHVNGFGSLSCSNCGKGLFDENGTESFSATGVGSEPEPPAPKKPGDTLLWIGFLVVCVLILAAIGMSVHESPSNGAGTAPAQQTADAAPQTDAFGFGADQNDATGYDGNKWGTPVSTFLGQKADLSELSNIVTGQNGHIPDDFGTILNVPMRSTESAYFKNAYDWPVVPKKFWEILTDSTHRFFDNSELTCGNCPDYVFYDNELAMVIVPLRNANYAPVLQDLAKKYQQVGSVAERWNRATDDRMGSGVNIALFRGGNSNTRIYLIQNLDDHGNPDTEYFGLFAIYVPTYYLWAIQHDIQGLIDHQKGEAENAAESERTAAREKEQKHLDEDLVKIQ